MLFNLDWKSISLPKFWKRFIEVKLKKQQQTVNLRLPAKGTGDTLEKIAV